MDIRLKKFRSVRLTTTFIFLPQNILEMSTYENENNIKLKTRVIGALKSRNKEVLKAAVDCPLVNILMASIQGE